MMSRLKQILNPAVLLGIALLVLLVARPPLHSIDHLALFKKPSVHQDSEGTDLKKFGIDVSHYQGEIDWSVVQKDISFAYVKATDGTSFVDPYYERNSTELSQSKLLNGAYHFYEPKEDSEQQAAHFVNTVKEFNHKLRPVLDIEITDDKPAEEISAGAMKWLQYVEDKLGCKPMIYTYASFWDSYLGDKFNDYSFWLAAWTTKSEPVPPKTRSDWQLWQFSNQGKIDGIDGLVDRDLFDNAEQQLDKLLCS